MKILIVGGGSSLARVLLPALSSFAEVVTAGRSGCDVELDLACEYEQFQLPKDLDVVVHLAAHFGGEDFAGILAAEKVNALGSLKLCHAAQSAGVRHLVQVSTIFVSLVEESPFFSGYALSKRHAEDLVRLYCAGVNLPFTILRPAQIYGVGSAFRKHQPFLYNIIDKAENNDEIVFHGSNDARRNLIHAEDVAEVIARVVRLRILGTHSCTSLTNIKYSEIAAAAINAFDSRSQVRFAAHKPDILDNAFEPDDSLYRQLEFLPQVTFDFGMKKEAAYRKGLR